MCSHFVLFVKEWRTKNITIEFGLTEWSSNCIRANSRNHKAMQSNFNLRTHKFTTTEQERSVCGMTGWLETRKLHKYWIIRILQRTICYTCLYIIHLILLHNVCVCFPPSHNAILDILKYSSTMLYVAQATPLKLCINAKQKPNWADKKGKKAMVTKTAGQQRGKNKINACGCERMRDQAK